MEIKKEWFKDNFEQKFYLFCSQKEFKIEKINNELTNSNRPRR
jgi:hypothetical protein